MVLNTGVAPNVNRPLIHHGVPVILYLLMAWERPGRSAKIVDGSTKMVPAARLAKHAEQNRCVLTTCQSPLCNYRIIIHCIHNIT